MIKFGTDGWRDIIGEHFTYANVARVAQAHARYLKNTGGSSVAVGFDTRFGSDRFARVAAGVFAASGIKTYLAKSYTPTPVLSFAVTQLKAAGGVMITASHNPAEYDGYKLKGSYGGSATPSIVRGVEAELVRLGTDPKPFPDWRDGTGIESFDLRDAYLAALGAQLDLKALRAYKGKLYHDAMGGAGAGWLASFIRQAKLELEFHPVHGEANPTFYGVHPEPIPQNLTRLSHALAHEASPTFGAVTDGDADRIGAVLAGGHYFNSHQILAVLLNHLYNKGLRGRVVKTVSSSQIIDLLAQKHGLEVLETPVGFKYITDAFLEGAAAPSKRVLIGGEESGGIAVTGHIPERDGLLNALLLLESVVVSGKSLDEQFQSIEQEVGVKHAFDRRDLHLEPDYNKAELMERAQHLTTLAGRSVTKVDTKDGVKLWLDGLAWVLFRASGTEPLVRVYCEASDSATVKGVLEEATKLVVSKMHNHGT